MLNKGMKVEVRKVTHMDYTMEQVDEVNQLEKQFYTTCELMEGGISASDSRRLHTSGPRKHNFEGNWLRLH